MVNHHSVGTLGAGQTGGSPQRPGRQVGMPALDFDLDTELRHLHAEDSWRQGTRNAKTLVKQPDFRIVLVALKRGARIEPHRAPGRISIQTLKGRLLVTVEDHTVDLPAGHILAVNPHVAHEVVAGEDEDSALLLTIAWPAEGVEVSEDQGLIG